MSDLSDLPTATLIERWHALEAICKAPLGSLVNDKQVDVIDGVILDAQSETHKVLACRPVRSSEEAHALIGVDFEILKDGPRNDEAGERILLSVADYLKGGGNLWDGWEQR
jgi:hypothetical protein